MRQMQILVPGAGVGAAISADGWPRAAPSALTMSRLGLSDFHIVGESP